MDALNVWVPVALAVGFALGWVVVRIWRSELAEAQAGLAQQREASLRLELEQANKDRDKLQVSLHGATDSLKQATSRLEATLRSNQALADAAHALQEERNNWVNSYHQVHHDSAVTQHTLLSLAARCRAVILEAGLTFPAEKALENVVETFSVQQRTKPDTAPVEGQAENA